MNRHDKNIPGPVKTFMFRAKITGKWTGTFVRDKRNVIWSWRTPKENRHFRVDGHPEPKRMKGYHVLFETKEQHVWYRFTNIRRPDGMWEGYILDKRRIGLT